MRSPLPPGPRTESRAAALSAGLAMAAYCLAQALHGTYPFGARSRAVNDLGNQFVPFHAHFRDLLYGDAPGDLLFNWNSGYGVPFLPDFLTYLTNPFSLLVALFPRDHVEFPVFLVTLLSLGAAGAAMTYYLGRLRPGSPTLRALLSVGYGLCAWVLHDGFADPMWMWGPVALPLVGIAADWCLHGRRPFLAVLFVALAWTGNFYTAAMAILCGALVLLVRLLTDPPAGRRPGRVLTRAALTLAAATALAAPVLTVSYVSSKGAQPTAPPVYRGPPELLDYLAQLLPGGRAALPAPNIGIGLFGLLLFAVFPFQRAIPVKIRIGWYALTLAVAASFVWEPTLLAWHGLAVPNGSPYRAAFVLSGILTAVAWLALSHRPAPRELLAGLASVGVLLVVCAGRAAVGPATWPLAAGALVVAGALALHGLTPDRHTSRVAVTVLAAAVFGASTCTVLVVTELRDALDWYRPKATLNARSLALREELREADRWPAYRADPGPHEFANNDPLLLGGQGGSYYSSHVPARTARTLKALGGGWYMHGRHVMSPGDPVARALMGSRAYVPLAAAQDLTVRTSPPAPLVTVRPPGAPRSAGPGSSVFERQEAALGARVYEVPEFTRTAGLNVFRTDTEWLLPRQPPYGAWTTLTARCTPGSTAYLYAPWLDGRVLGPGTDTTWQGRRATTSNALRPIGTVPADGRLDLTFVLPRPQAVPRRLVGCLDAGALGRAVEGLREQGARRITAGGHSMTASLPPRSTGTAVFAVPAVPGWRCAADGAERRAPYSFGGLIGVPLGEGASRVSCTYRQAGLAEGAAVSGAVLVLLMVLGAVKGRAGRTGAGPERGGGVQGRGAVSLCGSAAWAQPAEGGTGVRGRSPRQ
ncbi:YfhO family protein [Streptomyces sp. NBC_00237]|uniref:YfhO family protein n=1 Tax=Streptomyces sp. NBC_00237 TaxID=2975687 RepID=UPI00224C8B47|nr:YfhO family protein [Streptomyces sp. NBC_00237]MCX5200744.1 YfhO family protein [Streptomyces sp. NBC_00237]